MSNSRTFANVSVEALCQMRDLGRTQYSIVFDPPDSPSASAILQTPLGEFVIHSVYDGSRAELTLTLVKKPWQIPASLVWNAFLSTLEHCREEAQPRPAGPNEIPLGGDDNPHRTADTGPDV